MLVFLLAACTMAPPAVPVEYGVKSAASSAGVKEPALPSSANIIRIGLLVPLHGPNENLGRDMVNAAQLAVFEAGDAKVELLPRDSGDDNASAAVAARDAVRNGARIILGPLLSSQTEAVRPIAMEANVPVLSFSNDISVVNPGVYVMGFLPKAEIETMLDSARKAGRQNIAVLTPHNPYGARVAENVASGNSNAKLYRYPESQKDFSALVQMIANDNPDAVMIADGGERLQTILATLRANPRLSTLQFYGTGLWDDPAILQDQNAAGALIPGTDPDRRRRFENAYYEAYGKKPLRLSSLAYDAASLATVLARHRGSQPLYVPEAFRDPAGFVGVDGRFRFDRDGRIERILTVATVRP